ncbi:MAG: M56 family metallopeptidase [Firmicutes bacterium]|nr:M56 family metallopeptidase [Bacillota bacterium]
MNTLFVNLIEQAVPISALIALLLAVSPLIKKSLVAKWRYFMWLFVAVKLILPFKIGIFGTPVIMEVPSQISGIPIMSGTTAVADIAAADIAAADIAGAEAAGHISLQTIFMLIWIFGAIMFAAYQLANYIAFKRAVRRWERPVSEERITAAAAEIKKSLGEKRKIDTAICKAVSTPMVFGFIKPKLLLPEREYTDEELRVILYHELIHFKRNDVWYKLLLLIANALNWFNPLVYIMANAANKDIELVCDGEVVKGRDMDFRCDYCRLILNAVHSGRNMKTPLSTCFVFSKRVIRERFGGILDLKKKRRGAGLFVIVALSVFASGSLVGFATEKSADVLEDDLRIIERPAAEDAQTPIASIEPTAPTASEPAVPPSSEPTERAYESGANVYDSADAAAEADYGQSDAYGESSEGCSDEEIAPDTAQYGENVIDLSKNTARLDIHFYNENESYTSSNVYIADENIEMVVAASGNVTVRVIDDATGEVVSESGASDSGSTIVVPSGAYSITAVSPEYTETDTDASIYVYGRDAE